MDVASATLIYFSPTLTTRKVIEGIVRGGNRLGRPRRSDAARGDDARVCGNPWWAGHHRVSRVCRPASGGYGRPLTAQ